MTVISAHIQRQEFQFSNKSLFVVVMEVLYVYHEGKFFTSIWSIGLVLKRRENIGIIY